MNILHISRTMGQGGAEKVVYQLCKESKNKMIVASTGGEYEKKLKKIGIKHYIIPDIDKKSIITILRTYFILRKIIKTEKIDIVHSHHRMAAFYTRLLNVFNHKFKRVYTAHNVFYNKKVLMKFALKGSTIIAVGNGVKNNLINYYSIKDKSINIIYNSIDKPKKIEIPSDQFIKNKENKIFIATIGRLSEQKGIDVFINAMTSIIKNNKNIYGIIIGDGELKDELISLVKKNNIENNIIFLGYRKDVLGLIKCMDFIVLPSRWEGFPLTLIETFSVNKTVIASNIDGNNEIVKNNENGLLFEKNNVEDLTNSINELLNDNEKKIRLEKIAYMNYKDKYSYEVFIDKYEKIYKNI